MASALLNPRVYFDIGAAGRSVGRLDIELFHDVLPVTAENFRALCTGETGLGYWLKPRWYKGVQFHRVVPGFMAQGGDFNFGNGNMGESIYGRKFRDEKFLYKHSRRGLVSMACGMGKHTNNSQFFLTFDKLPHLDEKHVVFGQIIEGFEVLKEIEKVGSPGGFPRYRCEIVNCGEYDRARHLGKFRKDIERPEEMNKLIDTFNPVPDEVWKKAKKIH